MMMRTRDDQNVGSRRMEEGKRKGKEKDKEDDDTDQAEDAVNDGISSHHIAIRTSFCVPFAGTGSSLQ